MEPASPPRDVERRRELARGLAAAHPDRRSDILRALDVGAGIQLHLEGSRRPSPAWQFGINGPPTNVAASCEHTGTLIFAFDDELFGFDAGIARGAPPSAGARPAAHAMWMVQAPSRVNHLRAARIRGDACVIAACEDGQCGVWRLDGHARPALSYLLNNVVPGQETFATTWGIASRGATVFLSSNSYLVSSFDLPAAPSPAPAEVSISRLLFSVHSNVPSLDVSPRGTLAAIGLWNGMVAAIDRDSSAVCRNVELSSDLSEDSARPHLWCARWVPLFELRAEGAPRRVPGARRGAGVALPMAVVAMVFSWMPLRERLRTAGEVCAELLSLVESAAAKGVGGGEALLVTEGSDLCAVECGAGGEAPSVSARISMEVPDGVFAARGAPTERSDRFDMLCWLPRLSCCVLAGKLEGEGALVVQLRRPYGSADVTFKGCRPIYVSDRCGPWQRAEQRVAVGMCAVWHAEEGAYAVHVLFDDGYLATRFLSERDLRDGEAGQPGNAA